MPSVTHFKPAGIPLYSLEEVNLTVEEVEAIRLKYLEGLEQEVLCMGSATKGVCGTLCVKVNIACRGCFGPPAEVADQGAKLASSIPSIYDAKSEEDITKMVNKVIDSAGTF